MTEELMFEYISACLALLTFALRRIMFPLTMAIWSRVAFLIPSCYSIFTLLSLGITLFQWSSSPTWYFSANAVCLFWKCLSKLHFFCWICWILAIERAYRWASIAGSEKAPDSGLIWRAAHFRWQNVTEYFQWHIITSNSRIGSVPFYKIVHCAKSSLKIVAELLGSQDTVSDWTADWQTALWERCLQ